MTHVMKLTPPQFAPGPVDGAALTKAFATFYQYVLARMDLRYPSNDFGGLGVAGEVLTSTGTQAPTYMPTGFPNIPNDTVVGNISGGTGPAAPITQAQLTALINLATTLAAGDVPTLPGDATKFFNGNGAYVVPSYPVGANPSASVGLTAVNGSAITWMRSDGAPALDQAITPTWSGQHIWSVLGEFSASGEALKIVGDAAFLNFRNTANSSVLQLGTVNAYAGSGSTTNAAVGAIATLNLYSSSSVTPTVVMASGKATFNGNVSVNGNSPPAQVTGWGTPTGQTVVNNFSGTLATLLQTSEVVAQIITDLKAFGLYGA